jgi:hypothetical protein
MYSDQQYADFDMHQPANLRGIPGNRVGVGVENIHNQITHAWNEFAASHPFASQAEIDAFAARIDAQFEGFWWR